MTKALLLIAVLLALIPGVLQAQQQSCYLVYQTTRFHCYEYVDPTYGYMGQCNSYDVYSTDCYYTAENPIVIEPPGFFGGGVVDPAWMYVSAIDDTDPADIRVKVSASNQLDLFSLSYNAAPYGTGYGTGDVWISGVPARDLGATGTFYVQGCDSEGGICAAASTNTWVTESQKTEFSSVIAWYPQQNTGLRVESYPHSITVRYDVRGYGVTWGPGNARIIAKDGFSGFTYDYVRRPPTVRTEELRWRLHPHMSFANSCFMTEWWNTGGSVEPPSSTTSFQGCSTESAVGNAGDFAGRILQIVEQTPGGVGLLPAAFLTDNEVTVSLP